jgi:hypothetical protein
MKLNQIKIIEISEKFRNSDYTDVNALKIKKICVIII